MNETDKSPINGLGNVLKESIAEAGFQHDGHVTNGSLAAQWKVVVNEMSRQESLICQILGKALGYPWYKDDQKNFPGATEADGVCVGEHTAETIAGKAATVIKELVKLRMLNS